MAREILPMDVPSDLKGMGAISIMGMKMAMLGTGQNAADGKMLMLMSYPDGMTPEQMSLQMDEQMENQGKSRNVVEELEAEKFTVRGAEIEAQVQLTADENGEHRMIQYTLVLDGSGGKTVMMMVMGTEAEVNHEYVQGILDGVKAK